MLSQLETGQEYCSKNGPVIKFNEEALVRCKASKA